MAIDTTFSERYLTHLCRNSFLKLWSWPNVCKDQKWGNSSQGKEICDLLVVFENNIIIFSDKYCRFPSSGNLQLDWGRWFKRAVWKSANQIWGAERWLLNHPGRVFIDRACTKPFPISLPSSEAASIIRIVVAHGSGGYSKRLFGGSGSLMIRPDLIGKHHFDPQMGDIEPFTVGRLDENKGFVHIVDDFSLDVLLRTLDTTPDFIRYLKCKENFINSGSLGMAAGEEELLAYCRVLRHKYPEAMDIVGIATEPLESKKDPKI